MPIHMLGTPWPIPMFMFGAMFGAIPMARFTPIPMPGLSPICGPIPVTAATPGAIPILTFMAAGGGRGGEGKTLAPALPRPDPTPIACPIDDAPYIDFLSSFFLLSDPPHSSFRNDASVSWMPKSAKGFTFAAKFQQKFGLSVSSHANRSTTTEYESGIPLIANPKSICTWKEKQKNSIVTWKIILEVYAKSVSSCEQLHEPNKSQKMQTLLPTLESQAIHSQSFSWSHWTKQPAQTTSVLIYSISNPSWNKN